MAKPKAPQKKVVQLDEERAELISCLPAPPKGSKTPAPVPYLKGFKNESTQVEINGSVLMFTACSSKKWVAPGTRKPRRRAMA